MLLPKGVAVNSGNVMNLPEMSPIEAELQRRLVSRQNDAIQTILDETKIGDQQYYRGRLREQLLTAEAFPREVRQILTYLDEYPFDVARKVYDAFFTPLVD